MNRRRVLIVYGAWLLGASLLTGVLIVVRVGPALEHFGGEVYLGRIVGLSIFEYAARIAAMAGCFGLVMGLHGRIGDGRVAMPDIVLLFGATPVATLTGVPFAVGGAALAARVGYNIAPTDFCRTLGETVILKDFLLALLQGSAQGLVLGVVAIAGAARLLRGRGHLALKLVATCLAAGTLMLAVDEVLGRVLLPTDAEPHSSQGGDNASVGTCASRPA